MKNVTIEDVKKMIEAFNNDSKIIKLRNYYSTLTWMDILDVTRNENAHSSFLSWLFNANENYGLGTMPLKLLLELLFKEDNEKFPHSIDSEDLLTRNLDIEKVEFTREYSTKSSGRIDIYGSFNIDDKQYALVIENKIKSHENVEEPDNAKKCCWQTDKYFDYFSSKPKTVEYIYIFLSPVSKDGKVVQAHNKQFINISYSMLVDGVIKPLISLYDSKIYDKAISILKDYLKILNKPNNTNTKESDIVLYAEDGDGILKQIQDEHKELIDLCTEDCNAYDNDVINLLRKFCEVNDDILLSICPLKPRNSNRTFADLDIKPGTKLYLTKRANKTDRATRPDGSFVEVTTIDNKSTVEFISPKDNTSKVKKISPAAKELALAYTNSKNSSFNGFQWFAIKEEDGQLTILASYRKKN